MRITHESKGFTLVEFTIATAVATVVMAATVQAVSSAMPALQVSDATSDLTMAILATRAKAVIEQETAIMPIDVSRGSYTVYTSAEYSDGGGGGGGVTNPTEPAVGEYWLEELPRDVRFVRPDSGNAVNCAPSYNPYETAIAFDPSGRLLSNTRPATIHFGIPDEEVYKRISISLSGAVTTATWNGRKWQ